MPRLYIEIRDEPYYEAMRRATGQRRSTREQIAYDVEQLYQASSREPPEPRPDLELAEAVS